MSHAGTTLRSLAVDLSNPGQFFACCGLMELAYRVEPEVTGWFDNGHFEMSVPVGGVIDTLKDATLTPVPLPDGSKRAKGGTPDKIAPLQIQTIGFKGPPIIIDWWLDDDVSDFKSWAGGQAASGAAIALHAALAGEATRANFLDLVVPTDLKPYYYDSRAGGNAIDLGFMDSSLTTSVYAATELLAFIGLQRFRPASAAEESRWGRRYASWSSPLSVSLAAAVAACSLPTLEQQRWRYEMTWRDAAGRYKAFGRAYPEPVPPSTSWS